ncbi:MAG: serine--tRNA ligase [Candidatus Micrarchaeota archaeon]|nr:serine--tRNA ligase [Candidatus Micrarchaeota archaeon]
MGFYQYIYTLISLLLSGCLISARYVRDNLDAIKASMKKRQWEFDIDRILILDERWRALKTETQALQEKRNKSSLAISELKKKKNEEEAEEVRKTLVEVKAKIEENEKALADHERQINDLLWNMPNILHSSVPYGKDESENVVVRKFMEPKQGKAKGHEEILTNLGLLDIERAAKTAGARFYYLKGDLVLLDYSLMRYALDLLGKKGYVPVEPPYMLRQKLYKGVTALGDFDEVLYKIGGGEENDDLRLIATSEHSIAAMFSDEILDKSKLPLKYAGISPAFRMEVGTHGKDTKGIFRVHQFNKIEQFAFTRPEDSWAILDEAVANHEQIFKELKIPYRIMNMCTGDLGIVAAKKYDLEAYMPSQDKYREMGSCSNCTDWQSMRLNIRFEDAEERKYVHTINATAIATSRTMVAIIENYVNDDGTITVPDVLVPYMGKRKIG